MIDRQRLADFLGSTGDVRDLAEEVVRLMGEKRAAEDQLRTARSETALWQADAGEAREQLAQCQDDAAELSAQVAAVLAEVPKTRRGQFAALEERVTGVAAGAS